MQECHYNHITITYMELTTCNYYSYKILCICYKKTQFYTYQTHK